MDLKEYQERILGEGETIDLEEQEVDAQNKAILLVLALSPYEKTVKRIQNELEYNDLSLGLPFYFQFGNSDIRDLGGNLVLDANKFKVFNSLLESYSPKFFEMNNGIIGKEILITDLLHTLHIGGGLSIHEFI